MKRALAALIALAASSASAAAAPVTPAQWRIAAETDFAALRDIVIADTPIGAGVAGAEADAWLAQGYDEGRARAARVVDRAGYRDVLAAYARGFGDPHLRVEARGFSSVGALGVGASATWGLTQPAPGIVWIGVPSFADDDPRLAGPRLPALIAEIEAQGASFRAGRAIIIDLRGNAGGATAYARGLARAVFGARVINRVPPANQGGALWRVSAANAAYWRDERARLAARFGANSASGRWARGVEQGLARALERGEPIWRQGARRTGASGGLTRRRPHGGARPFPAYVFVLSNGSCISACLDFADIALHVPGVLLTGVATAGDGLLAEVRAVTLPSGEASIVIPQKLMLGRGRGAMEVYQPDIAHFGTWDDASVRGWVIALADRD